MAPKNSSGAYGTYETVKYVYSSFIYGCRFDNDEYLKYGKDFMGTKFILIINLYYYYYCLAHNNFRN